MPIGEDFGVAVHADGEGRVVRVERDVGLCDYIRGQTLCDRKSIFKIPRRFARIMARFPRRFSMYL